MMMQLQYGTFLAMRPNVSKDRGFSLVELAVVLVLIGIVVTMGLKATMATLENSTYSTTKSKQDQLRTALIGYLRTNGRLPCPDTSVGVPSGTEVSPCNSSVGASYGVIPWQTLGIPRDAVIDGWGNFFTYRVANGTGGSRNWTAKVSVSSDFSVNELKSQTDAITIQEIDNSGTALANTTQKAVVVIVSHGKNGFGAKTTKVSDRIPLTDAGAGETTNGTNSTAIFVLRPVNEAGGFNGVYDDIVSYLMPQDLLQPLVNEGTLKACQAYCSPPITASCTAPGLCTCSTVGVPGTSDTSNPCTGLCGTCTMGIISSTCTPLVTPPVGVRPTNCI